VRFVAENEVLVGRGCGGCGKGALAGPNVKKGIRQSVRDCYFRSLYMLLAMITWCGMK
jgi:hypothetical protein